MNLQQLEYIVSVDTHRHFVKASETCFVTQATLSMMIKKLEEELDIVIFDRSKQPVVPTELGAKIISQAKVVLMETKRVNEIISNERGEIAGDLRLGVIPTVAPYLLPFFLNRFLLKYPKVSIKINEFTTEQLIEKLINQEIDVAILATPLNNTQLLETPIYYEKFIAYTPGQAKYKNKKYLLPKDIDVNKLWLLEEGHCLRSQIVNLCELRKKTKEHSNLQYEAGSIETLIRMTESNNGITILPEMVLGNLTKEQLKNIYPFKAPEPAREVSIVTYRHFLKGAIINSLKSEILSSIPKEMLNVKKKEKIEI
ncbi:MAG: LysR family transcriptional regulator [Bacteroidia bacterium]|nr:LysR family transcriptional regulator [Bacteroidia bacterium]